LSVEDRVKSIYQRLEFRAATWPTLNWEEAWLYWHFRHVHGVRAMICCALRMAARTCGLHRHDRTDAERGGDSSRTLRVWLDLVKSDE